MFSRKILRHARGDYITPLRPQLITPLRQNIQAITQPKGTPDYAIMPIKAWLRHYAHFFSLRHYAKILGQLRITPQKTSSLRHCANL